LWFPGVRSVRGELFCAGSSVYIPPTQLPSAKQITTRVGRVSAWKLPWEDVFKMSD
jgi:hypothetical protein